MLEYPVVITRYGWRGWIERRLPWFLQKRVCLIVYGHRPCLGILDNLGLTISGDELTRMVEHLKTGIVEGLEKLNIPEDDDRLARMRGYDISNS